VATDDFDDVLAEFAASDLQNTANFKSTTTAANATVSTVANPTEEEIDEACAAGNLTKLRQWGPRGIRVASPHPLLRAVVQKNLQVLGNCYK
jgi:hypothetical protein